MPPEVILYVHASVALPSLQQFPDDILCALLCAPVLWRAGIAPFYISLRPRPILPARLPPTRHPCRVEPRAYPSGILHARTFFPDTTGEALSEGGSGRGRGARAPIWRVLGCFTNKEYEQRHCLLPRTSVRLPLTRLHFPLCYRTTNTITPALHLAMCLRPKLATMTKARGRDRMANQRSNLSCKAVVSNSIRKLIRSSALFAGLLHNTEGGQSGSAIS